MGKRADGDAIKVKEGSVFNKKRPCIGYPIDKLCEKPLQRGDPDLDRNPKRNTGTAPCVRKG